MLKYLNYLYVTRASESRRGFQWISKLDFLQHLPLGCNDWLRFLISLHNVTGLYINAPKSIILEIDFDLLTR